MVDPDEVEEKLKSMDGSDNLTWLDEQDEYIGFTVDPQTDYGFEGATIAFVGRDRAEGWAEEHEQLDELLTQLGHYVYYGNNLVVFVTDEELDIDLFNLLSEPDSEDDQMELG